MSTYYKRIDGKNYDKAMLDIAEKSVTGKGDGRISLADSRNIIKLIKDGGKITDIEKRTLNYILENYKLTETALKHIEKSLSDNIDSVSKKDVDVEKSMAEIEDNLPAKQTVNYRNWRKKIIMIIMLILLALFAVLAFFKYFYKTSKIENTLNGNEGNISNISKEEKAVTKTEKTVELPVVNKNEMKKEKPPVENEYIVKDKDTLVKISEAVYGDYKMWKEIYKLNKGKISNPTILFPGQVLLLPEKKGNR